MNFTPVDIGSDTDSRGMIPGAFSSTRRRVLALMGPAPSTGFPRASTTRPNSSSPIGTSTIASVCFTESPSMIVRSSPKITTPTLSVSRLSAMPLRPDENSTISPAFTVFRRNLQFLDEIGHGLLGHLLPLREVLELLVRLGHVVLAQDGLPRLAEKRPLRREF